MAGRLGLVYRSVGGGEVVQNDQTFPRIRVFASACLEDHGMGQGASSRPAVAAWLHLALLVALVSILEAGRVATNGSGPFMLAAFARSLYLWLPALAAISISINGPRVAPVRTLV